MVRLCLRDRQGHAQSRPTLAGGACLRYSEIMTESIDQMTPEMLLAVSNSDSDLAEVIQELFGGDMAQARAALAKGLPHAIREYRSLAFPLSVYRGFKEQPRIHALGKHWTTLEQVAKNFAESMRMGWVVQAIIQQDAVDWPGTLARSILFDDQGESEITLQTQASVKVIKLLARDLKRARWLVQHTDKIGRVTLGSN